MIGPPCVVELYYGKVLVAGKSVCQVEGSPLEMVSEVLDAHWFDSHLLVVSELLLEESIVF